MHLRTLPHARNGSALLFSVVAVMVVSILAAGFLQLALSVTRRLNSSSDTLQALNLAEAGLAEAYTGLAVARTGAVGSAEAPAVFGGGLLWVEATTHAGGLVELQSTAMYGTGRATLGLVCEPVPIGVGSLGFFTRESLRLNPDTRLDSYDSSQGTYLEQLNTPLNNQGVVGSNEDVVVAPGDLVFGDVIHGPTGKSEVGKGAVVTGSTSARPELEVLPPIEPPAIPLAKAHVHTGGMPMVVPPGEAGYASLEVGKNAELVLKGPLQLVLGSLRLRSGATLLFDTGDGPVELYVQEELDLDTASSVSTSTQTPADSLIYVTAAAGKTIQFGAKSQFHGFVYAPDADVQVAAKFEIFGGLVCNSAKLAAQGKLHYDRALGAKLESRLPLLHSWRVVELPQQAAAKRIDPFQVLGLDPDTLVSPSEAHEEQVLDVRYVGTDGGTHSYSGSEEDFDWNLVSELVYGLRDGLAFFLPGDYAVLDPVARNPLLDLVDSALSSKDLRDALLAAGSVPTEVLVAACERVPPMSKSDLRNVLDAQPLSPEVLRAAIASSALDSSALKNVLIDNSPLPSDILTAVLARIPPLGLSDLLNVLANQ